MGYVRLIIVEQETKISLFPVCDFLSLYAGPINLLPIVFYHCKDPKINRTCILAPILMQASIGESAAS